ncbi:hypothetical protein AIOL_001563 [Candidatus Rhodobacter oscarellae]|uniref:Uncharacterized protein n=1 Tax=Candidatus Rhodobacter oscarellae TaxID=1675527 RepID=A0A0J9E468_9RHOB|nr:hypothetical protein [Candidatus Rhodobacter lobularis]KMW56609.1 hypothetical protein AIOL_001563 [Candidatus Rhodobacter lobularis]
MSDITELERRITAALDRIGTQVDQLKAGAAGPDPAALEEALEAEKVANAQLEERVKSLREQNEAQLNELERSAAERVAEAEAERDKLRGELQEAKAQNRSLNQATQKLQASLQALSAASANGVEPHMLNQAMMSELEALRAVRTADVAEMDDILGAMKPLLTEAANDA